MTVALFPGVDFDVIPTTKSNMRDITEIAVISLLFTEDLIGSDDEHPMTSLDSISLLTANSDSFESISPLDSQTAVNDTTVQPTDSTARS